MSEAASTGEVAGTSPPRGFASDNHAGAHPEVMAAIAAANSGHAPAYGADSWTAAARECFRAHFGATADAYPVLNGSGANLACLDAVTRSYEAVICARTAHLNVDECGAPERIAGTKLLTVATPDGKLRPDDLVRWEPRRGDDHFAQPRIVSITQATELGTVYTAEETAAIATAAHDLGMLVHVDGARLANAAAALDLPLRALSTDVGVDLLSFGGTKNGLLLGEAAVFLRPGLGEGFEFVRKQLGQLASKMRFISAQFEALLGGDLWLRCARHANAMAARLAAAVVPLPEVEIVHPVESNAVFARLPDRAVDRLLAGGPAEQPFHVWDGHVEGDEGGGPPGSRVVRWMCSWDTSAGDVDGFAARVASALAALRGAGAR